MSQFQCGVIIAAGVVGLAIAAELAPIGCCRELWVLDKEQGFGRGVSSRNSLGVHVTLDLSGRMRLGPDTEYIDRIEEYSVPADRLDTFFAAASRYLPWLQREDLNPEMAGIRPKLQGPGDSFADFVIRREQPGWVNCVGIESPGLTASPAIAAYVRKLLE